MTKTLEIPTSTFSPRRNGRNNKIVPPTPKSMRTLHAEAIREKIARMAAENMDSMVQAQINIASNEKLAYSPSAFKGLLEHSIGRPTESIELKGRIGIVQLIKNLDNE